MKMDELETLPISRAQFQKLDIFKNVAFESLAGYLLGCETITVEPGTEALNVGETAELTAKVDPSNATDPTVTWTSSDETVATVDANGKVTAVGGGTATITAKAGDVILTKDHHILIAYGEGKVNGVKIASLNSFSDELRRYAVTYNEMSVWITVTTYGY